MRAISNGALLATLPASTNLPAFTAEWSADNRYLAVKRDYKADGWQGDWEIWDVAKAQQVLHFQNLLRKAVCFHPRLPRLLVGHLTNGAAIWNVDEKREIVRFSSIGQAAQLQFAPDGERFAATHVTNKQSWSISIYDSATAIQLATCPFPGAIQRTRPGFAPFKREW